MNSIQTSMIVYGLVECV